MQGAVQSCVACGVQYAMCQSMWKSFRDALEMHQRIHGVQYTGLYSDRDSLMHLKTQGCTLTGRQTVTEWVPGIPIISNSPRFFSASFLEGQVVQKNFAFTYTWLPILKAGDGICWQSAAF